MSLKTWVNDEGTSRWVHGSNQLGVFDVHERELVLVIPMLIVPMLSKESNSSLGVIGIGTWHVEIINEVDEFLRASWSEQSTSLLLKLLLQDQLQQVCGCVEVEVYNLLDVVAVWGVADFVKETLNDLGLTESSKSCQHWAVVDLNHVLHDELSGDGVWSWDCVTLNTL